MKGRNDGVENEKRITEAINGQQIGKISAYLRGFIRQLDKSAPDDTVINAKKIGGQGFKPDIEIKIADEVFNVSVKKGGGNSVHQEKTDYFIHYCMKHLKMSDIERESLLLFLYGDGTIDGDSLPEERLSDRELIEAFDEEIQVVQKFFDKNKRNLLERFLVYGRLGKDNDIKADYLYHGDASDGIWCPLNSCAVDYLMEQPNSNEAPLAIGPLTVQVWNRNLEARPEMENRRHSIQVKWGSCKTHIQKINELYLKTIQEEQKDVQRVKGNNKQGFENQDKLITIIDGSRICDLPLAVKNIVTSMFPDAATSEFVRAMKLNKADTKARIAIEVNGERKNLSVFMGSGNAVHQETLKNFLEFCKKELQMEAVEETSLLKIMYGDGTVTGQSEAADRLKNTAEVKKNYVRDVRIAQEFFDKNKKDLVERFLVYGKAGKEKNVKSDYIYYGTDVAGKILPYPTVVEYIINQEGSESALLSVGSLTSQPWNRNPEAKANLESRRHSIQIKWGGMKRDIAEIAENIESGNIGTSDGNWEEYELVSKLNRDKRHNNKLWSILCNKLDIMNLDDVYAVRVSDTVYSKLSERKVLPKADVYLIKGKIAHQVLLDNNYWLDEDVVKNMNVKPIEQSGVSCKRPTSKNFTYAKLTVHSFVKLFGSKEIGAGISLFVKDDELSHNEEVLKAWDVTETELLTFFGSELKGLSQMVENFECCKKIKKAAITYAEPMIRTQRDISNALFYGIGAFEEPYTANFIFANGVINPTYIPKFSITTGSGRHKGNYTIVIKP